jgi:hypothetical protein
MASSRAATASKGGGEGLVAAQHDDRAGDERETVRGVTDLA